MNVARFSLKPALLAAAIACAVRPAGLAALELGGITPLSGPGQPLFAEVRLEYGKAEELSQLTLSVLPANGQPADSLLRSVSARLLRDAAGSAFIELTSNLPVTVPVLKFALQLEQGGQSYSREYALDFTVPADKTRDGARRGQRIEHLKQARIGHPPVGEPAAAGPKQYGPVQAGETLFSVARRYRGDPPLPVLEVMQRLHATNPAAFADGRMDRLLAGSVLQIPEDLARGGETLAEAPAALPRTGLNLSLDRHIRPARAKPAQPLPPSTPPPAREAPLGPSDGRAAEGITLKLSTLETRLASIESRLEQQDKTVAEALRQSEARLARQDGKLAEIQQQLNARLDSLERAQQGKPAAAAPPQPPSDAMLQALRAELGKRLEELQAQVARLENELRTAAAKPAEAAQGQTATAVTPQAVQELHSRLDGLQAAVERLAAARQQDKTGVMAELAALAQQIAPLQARVASLVQESPSAEAAAPVGRAVLWGGAGTLALLLALLTGWLAQVRRRLQRLEALTAEIRARPAAAGPTADDTHPPASPAAAMTDDAAPTWVPPLKAASPSEVPAPPPSAATPEKPEEPVTAAPLSPRRHAASVQEATAPAKPAAAQSPPAPKPAASSPSPHTPRQPAGPHTPANSQKATALPPQEQDLMTEVDLHVSFENYREAAALLTQLCARHPNDIPLRVKLLTMLYRLRDRARFVEEAETLSTIPGARRTLDWEEVRRMGRELAPNDSLFGGSLNSGEVFQSTAGRTASSLLFTPMSPVEGESVPIEDLLRQGSTTPLDLPGLDPEPSDLNRKTAMTSPGQPEIRTDTRSVSQTDTPSALQPPPQEAKQSLERELLSWMDRSLDIDEMLSRTGQHAAGSPHEELQAGLEAPLSMQSLQALDIMQEAELGEQARSREHKSAAA